IYCKLCNTNCCAVEDCTFLGYDVSLGGKALVQLIKLLFMFHYGILLMILCPMWE
ncbi:MAG: hypothetical protein ACI8RD_011661, partial [Bacillariaceae sp.]